MQVTGIDYYPLRPVPGSEAGPWAVGDIVRRARTLGAKRIWVLPQCFAGSSWRSATVAEFRIQIFSALAEGATGFIIFSYADRPGWARHGAMAGMLVDPFGNPSPNWDEFRRLGRVLRP